MPAEDIAAAPEQTVSTDDDGRLRVTVSIAGKETWFGSDDGAWSADQIERMRLLILSSQGFWTGVYDGPDGAGEINRPEDGKTLCNPASSYSFDADCSFVYSFDPTGTIDGAEDARCHLFIQFEDVFGFGARYWFLDAAGDRYLENASYDDVVKQGRTGLPCDGATPMQ